MSFRSTRRHAFLAAAGALLYGLLASTFAMAQSAPQLDDMVGLWAEKSTCAGTGQPSYYVYQATTGPASLTLRYMRTDTSCGAFANHDLYQLTVTGRSLSGTYTVDTSATVTMAGCPLEQRTFPVQGRISLDWNTITIVHNHEGPNINPCGWTNNGEYVDQFERYH